MALESENILGIESSYYNKFIQLTSLSNHLVNLLK